MISKLASQFTDKLLSNGTIDAEDKELYNYGIFMLISHLLFFIVSCVLGLVLKCLLEGIIFYVAFMLIRGYAGGYHASSESKCEILSTLSIAMSIVVIKMAKVFDFQITLLVIGVLSAICILALCPLDTPEKPLSKKEFRYFRKISLIILLIIGITVIVSFFCKIEVVMIPCCMSVILESILLIAGKIKKVYQNRTIND